MDWNSAFEVLKYSFMGIFIIYFIMDIVSKRSYKIHYYIAITGAVIFTALLWNWSIGFKVGFISLFILLTVKTIFDERRRGVDIDGDKAGV